MFAPVVIRFTDDQLSAVFAAARPIAVDRRDAFLTDVDAQFANRSAIGDGELFRVLLQLQRRHCDYPDTTGFLPRRWA
jgi:hypothetical protein